MNSLTSINTILIDASFDPKKSEMRISTNNVKHYVDNKKIKPLSNITDSYVMVRMKDIADGTVYNVKVNRSEIEKLYLYAQKVQNSTDPKIIKYLERVKASDKEIAQMARGKY